MPQDGSDDSAKNSLAEDRTHWAEDRTVLANERTFAGWMRTGMAAIAIAVGLRAVFRETDPTWLPKSVATIFILAALYIFWAARVQACKALDRLNTHAATPQTSRMFTILWAAFSLSAVTTCVVLWML